MRTLVIGAGGYLGGPIAGRLAAVPGMSVATPGRARLDLAAAPAEIAGLLREIAPDAIVNASGRTSGTDADLVAGNVLTTGNLVAAIRLAVPDARLVHLGSAAEYGPGITGQPVRESDPADPIGVYGTAKLTATHLVLAGRLDAAVLRVFNPIGPGAPAGTLPGRLAAELRRGANPIHTGPLDAVRDFVDVSDVAAAVLAAVVTPGRLPAVINIGSGRPVVLRELAAGLFEAARSAVPLIEDAAGSARSHAVPWQCADITVAREALGWSPRVPLRESLRRMWAETADVP
jgi:nucleoside-diphosphate-sugar epimerase